METATLTSSPSVHAADGVSRPQHDKALVQEEIENPTGVSNCSSNSQDSLEKPHSGGSDSQSIADDMFDRSQILTNSYEDQVGSKETDAGHLTAPAAAARQNTAQHAEGQTATAHLESPLAAMHDAAEAASAVSSVAQAGSALLSSTRCAEEDKANTHPEPEDGSVDSATATEDVPKGKTVTEARSVDLPAAAAGTSTVGLTATEGRPVYLTAASLKQADGHATPLRVATRRRSALVGDEQAPSSPVYGVATSSAFNSPDSAMSRASSRDWLGGIFSGRNTSRKAAREAVKGGVNPTRLFEGLTRASSTAEDLFDSWHGPKPHAGRN